MTRKRCKGRNYHSGNPTIAIFWLIHAYRLSAMTAGMTKAGMTAARGNQLSPLRLLFPPRFAGARKMLPCGCCHSRNWHRGFGNNICRRHFRSHCSVVATLTNCSLPSTTVSVSGSSNLICKTSFGAYCQTPKIALLSIIIPALGDG